MSRDSERVCWLLSAYLLAAVWCLAGWHMGKSGADRWYHEHPVRVEENRAQDFEKAMDLANEGKNVAILSNKCIYVCKCWIEPKGQKP